MGDESILPGTSTCTINTRLDRTASAPSLAYDFRIYALDDVPGRCSLQE